jgi:hypothetical protein
LVIVIMYLQLPTLIKTNSSTETREDLIELLACFLQCNQECI